MANRAVITALAPVSCEVIVVNDVALDVLRERHGVLEADEIKTGRLRPVDLARLRLQAGLLVRKPSPGAK